MIFNSFFMAIALECLLDATLSRKNLARVSCKIYTFLQEMSFPGKNLTSACMFHAQNISLFLQESSKTYQGLCKNLTYVSSAILSEFQETCKKLIMYKNFVQKLSFFLQCVINLARCFSLVFSCVL